MFESFKKKSLDRQLDEAMTREVEEELYARVLQEIERGERRDGLWAKALVAANGDESIAKAQYIKLRIQALFDDGLIGAFRNAELEVAKERAKKEEVRSRRFAQTKADYLRKVDQVQQQFESEKRDVNSDKFWTYATTDQLKEEFLKFGAKLEKLSGGWSVTTQDGNIHKVATRPSLEKLYRSVCK